VGANVIHRRTVKTVEGKEILVVNSNIRGVLYELAKKRIV